MLEPLDPALGGLQALLDGKVHRLVREHHVTDLNDHKIAIGITLQGITRFDAELDGFYRNPSRNPLLNRA